MLTHRVQNNPQKQLNRYLHFTFPKEMCDFSAPLIYTDMTCVAFALSPRGANKRLVEQRTGCFSRAIYLLFSVLFGGRILLQDRVCSLWLSTVLNVITLFSGASGAAVPVWSVLLEWAAFEMAETYTRNSIGLAWSKKKEKEKRIDHNLHLKIYLTRNTTGWMRVQFNKVLFVMVLCFLRI